MRAWVEWEMMERKLRVWEVGFGRYGLERDKTKGARKLNEIGKEKN
jgi:hypothetical protein